MTEYTEKPRRTGTYTAGIALIFAGVVLITGLFQKELAFEMLTRFSPLILILLGLEIIITNALLKDRPLKYDFLAGFICLVLVCASIGISAVSLYMDYYGPWQMQASKQKEVQLEQESFDLLKDIPSIERVEAFADYSGQKIDSLSSLPNPNYVDLSVELSSAPVSKADFANTCALISQRINDSGISPNQLSIENEAFSLRLSGPFMQHKDALQLESYVVSLLEES